MKYSKWYIWRIRLALWITPKPFKPKVARMIAQAIITLEVGSHVAEMIRKELK